MQIFSISTKQHKEALKNLYESLIESTKEEDLFSFDYIDGDYTAITCSVKKEDEDEPLFFLGLTQLFHRLLPLLADLLLILWEKANIALLGEEELKHYLPQDRIKIIDKVENSLKQTGIAKNKRMKLVQNKISTYLKTENKLNMDGFIQFRLKELEKETKEVFYLVARDLKLEAEYEEFIELLRYFVSIQIPLFDKIHVLAMGKGRYEILDPTYMPLGNDYVDDDLIKNKDQVKKTDLIISSLMNIAPKEIIFHYGRGVKEDSFFKTLEEIFEDRMVLCTDCALCRELGDPSITFF